MTVRYAAPGRINLIGEHTDYNLGWALPIALPQRTVVTFEPSDADAITVSSDRVDGSVRIPLRTKPGEVTGWAGYVAGVVWALRGSGHAVSGGTMSISSDVEMGSGLSSSAALECAALGAFVTAAGWHIDRLEQELDGFNAALPPLKDFILPGGGPAAAACHVARAVCRRAERRCWSLARAESVAPAALTYLNRLSDLLFVLARVLARSAGGSEVIWRRRAPKTDA